MKKKIGLFDEKKSMIDMFNEWLYLYFLSLFAYLHFNIHLFLYVYLSYDIFTILLENMTILCNIIVTIIVTQMLYVKVQGDVSPKKYFFISKAALS